MPRARLKPRRVDPRAIPGIEPEKAQNAQIILAQALIGLADENHPAGARVLKAARNQLVHRAIGLGIQRIQPEIAPAGILGPVGRESDHRAPAIGFDIPAQRRDLKRFAGANRGYRAVLKPGRDNAQARCLTCRHHRLR